MGDLPRFSAEVFPPQSAHGAERFADAVARLQRLEPEFISVTYGAGGSSVQASLQAVREVQAAGATAVPHLSAIGLQQADVRALLERYRALGIRRLVILRGDAPSGQRGSGDFVFASDLVRFIRASGGTDFHLDVAAFPECHPQARNSKEDLLHFKAKIDAGADSAITQYFFNADAYEDFLGRCVAAGITAPIVPGVMPIAQFARLLRFSEARGIDIPRWIRQRMEAFGDDRASIQAFGIDVVTQLCARLLALGAPSLHFFSLNNAERVEQICARLAS